MIVPEGQGPAHYRLSPSASKRWLKCPGSARADLPDSQNEYTRAGNVGHHAAEANMGTEWPLLVEDEVWRGSLEHLGHEASVGVASSVGLYLDVVDGLEGDKFHEIKIQHDSIQDLGGTIDTLAIREGRLTIVDLKTGTGRVPAKSNTQLMSYAILARQEWPTIRPIEAIIVQPRVYAKPQVTKFSPATLDKLERQIEEVADKDDLVPGSWCHWCPLKPTCKAYKDEYGV